WCSREHYSWIEIIELQHTVDELRCISIRIASDIC
nr:hypothetical protein [Tanacetum cinerariifolium]